MQEFLDFIMNLLTQIKDFVFSIIEKANEEK